MDVDQKTMPEATILLVTLTKEWTWSMRETRVAKSHWWECDRGLNVSLGNTRSSLWIVSPLEGWSFYPCLMLAATTWRPVEGPLEPEGFRNEGSFGGEGWDRHSSRTSPYTHSSLIIPERLLIQRHRCGLHPTLWPLSQAHTATCRPLFFCLKHEVPPGL